MIAPTQQQMSPDRTNTSFRDLGPRLVSGVALAALALGLTYAGTAAFSVLVLAVALLMSWEWGRVVRGGTFDLPFWVHATAVTVALGLAASKLAALGIVAALIGAIINFALRFGERGGLSALGVLYVGLPTVALVWLRCDEPWGFLAVLYLLLTVWATDIFAYIGGRTIGGPKLWPRLSPGKTWAGLLVGVGAGAITGVIFALLVKGTSPVGLGLLGLALGLVAQAGDLAESALKRGFDVKDASDLIPGHGGFLDRVDGVVFAAILAALVGLLVRPMAPARALLFWS